MYTNLSCYQNGILDTRNQHNSGSYAVYIYVYCVLYCVYKSKAHQSMFIIIIHSTHNKHSLCVMVYSIVVPLYNVYRYLPRRYIDPRVVLEVKWPYWQGKCLQSTYGLTVDAMASDETNDLVSETDGLYSAIFSIQAVRGPGEHLALLVTPIIYLLLICWLYSYTDIKTAC